MSLRLSSLSALAAIAALIFAAACTTPAVIAGTTGGSGGGTGGATVTTGTSTGSTSATTATGNDCTDTFPPSCVIDSDCGPPCTHLFCVEQLCVPRADECDTAGATRCVASAIQTCTLIAGVLGWSGDVACPQGESCNSDATQCIVASNTCTTSADCGCGCGCLPDKTCACTGNLPPTCTTDADCGPVCSGNTCDNGACVSPN